MCGIAGIITNDPQQLSLDKLRSMTDAIAHRGPDGEGYWISDDGKVGLGNRRLSIIDRSDAGKQPMHYLGRYTITFNGEIYNYIELREQLKKEGYSFSSQTDTEVVMAMYDWKGTNCLHHFDGMFSFALYDSTEKNIFCARDRFGEKPFYYHFVPGKEFVFGSEMKALWAGGVSHTVNEKMLYRYLAYNDDRNPENPAETFYTEIQRLPLSHYMLLSAVDISANIQEYWNIDHSKQDDSISESNAIKRFTELFYTSVSRRLRSDVEVGSSLSGGLDSSMVVKAIQEIDNSRDGKIKRNTFSAQFPGFFKDETYFQNLVVKETGVIHHTVQPAAEGMLENIGRVFKHQEEPFGSSSINAQFEVYESARKNNVIVLLDGQGADELLAGYPGEYIVPFLKGIKNKKNFLQQLKQFRDLHKNNKINPYRLLFWKALLPDSAVRMAKRLTKPAIADHKWLNRDFANTFRDEKKEIKKTVSLNKTLYKSAFEGELETLLRYADRNSMAHGVEVRLPFLNHELAEFIFTLPDRFKINNGWTKWIARRSFNKKLPDEITWRKEKVGFEPPDRNFEIAGTQVAVKEYLNENVMKHYLSMNGKDKLKPQYTWKAIMLHYLLQSC